MRRNVRHANGVSQDSADNRLFLQPVRKQGNQRHRQQHPRMRRLSRGTHPLVMPQSLLRGDGFEDMSHASSKERKRRPEGATFCTNRKSAKNPGFGDSTQRHTSEVGSASPFDKAIWDIFELLEISTLWLSFLARFPSELFRLPRTPPRYLPGFSPNATMRISRHLFLVAHSRVASKVKKHIRFLDNRMIETLLF